MNKCEEIIAGHSDLRYKSYAEFVAARYVWKIFPPLLLLVGTVGNILSIVILRRPKVRKCSCSIFFLALAISDLCVLHTGLLRQWIYKTFDFDIRHIGSASCKIHTWLVYVSLDFSSWILVAVTVERVFLVWFPGKAKITCTKQILCVSTFIIGTSLLLVNSHILYGRTSHIHHVNESTVIYPCCFISDKYKEFWHNIWQKIDLILFCGLPFFCLLFGNFLIFVKVLASRSSVMRHFAKPVLQRKKKNISNVSSISIMLLSVNTMFLICNTPISIYLIGIHKWERHYEERDHARNELIWSIVNNLMYLSNSINFLLYFVSGSVFRKEIKLMLRIETRPEKKRVLQGK